jgi:hypothetical protein
LWIELGAAWIDSEAAKPWAAFTASVLRSSALVRKEERKMKKFRGSVSMPVLFLWLSTIASAEGLRNFRATLAGAQEVPERESPAQGEITVRFDTGLTKMDVNLRVNQNTVGAVTRAHFHCARPGENGPIIFGLFDPGPFPVGNRVRGTLTNADLNPGQDCIPTTGIVVNNLASLAFAMREGLIYANVHTSAFPGGEIRGQMIEVSE